MTGSVLHSKPLPTPTPDDEARPVKVLRYTFLDGKLLLDILVSSAYPSETNAWLAAQIQDLYPTIASHACKNGRGRFFGDVIDDTSIPHLLEHMIIEELLIQETDERAIHVGNSRWMDKDTGRARIEVSFTDDLQVATASKQAVCTLNDVLLQTTAS